MVTNNLGIHALHKSLSQTYDRQAIGTLGDYWTLHSAGKTRAFLNPTEHNKATREELENFMAEMPKVPHDIKVYSGIGQDFAKMLSRYKTGDTVSLAAPVAASLHPQIANNKAWKVHSQKPGILRPSMHAHVLEMHIPGGAKSCAYIGDHSQYAHELEFLVGPGKKATLTNYSSTHDPIKNTTDHTWSVKLHD